MEQGPLQSFAASRFCDDVRFDVTGKRLEIGIYDAELLVGSMPAEVPLSLIVEVRSPTQQPHRQVKIEIESDGEIIQHFGPFAADPPSTPSPDKRFWRTMNILRIEPLKVARPQLIKVFATTETERLYAGSLDVKLAPSIQQAPAAIVFPLLALYSRMPSETLGREKMAVEIMDNIVRVLGTAPGDPQVQFFPLGPNHWRVFFSTPMRIAPRIQLHGLPDDVTASLSEITECGFTLKVEPPDRELPPGFHFEADAEL